MSTPSSSASKPLLSMTGFATAETATTTRKEPLRTEIRSLNHRFLDIKLRLPREYLSADPLARAHLQSVLGRGSIDLRIDRQNAVAASSSPGSLGPLQLNVELAQAYHAAVDHLVFKLGIPDRHYALEIARQPDVCQRAIKEQSAEESWAEIEPAVTAAVQKLLAVRAQEGDRLKSILLDQVQELRSLHGSIQKRRKEITAQYPARISEKIKNLWSEIEATTDTRTLLESRITQELALLLDRTDIEEELQRFAAHLDLFEKTLHQGGPVGRKIEFILQELGRECNTLGNKAQDFAISEETLQIKVRLEQCREQTLNLE